MRKLAWTFKVWLVCMAFVLTVAAGATAQTQVTMWICCLSADVEAWALEWEAEFNRQNPDIRLDLHHVPFADLGEKLILAAATGVAPDIAYYASNLVINQIDNGIARPLDEYFERMPDKDDFLPSVLDAVRDSEGRLYGLPYAMWHIADAYNLNVFMQNGVDLPQDWDELLAAARRNTQVASDGRVEVSGYGQVMNWALASYDLHMYMEQLGQGMLSVGDTSVSLNNEYGRRALTYLHELWRTGMPDLVSSHNYERLLAGTTAMMGYATPIAMPPHVLDSDILLRPTLGPTPDRQAVRHNAGNLYMLSTTQHPDEAWRVMESFVQPQGLAEFHKRQRTWLPVRRSLFPDIPELFPYNLAGQFFDLFSKPLYTYGPHHAYWIPIRQPGGELILSAARGEMPINSALEEAERVMNGLLREHMGQ